MKMKKLRVFVGILIIVVSLCLMSSCSGGTPSKSKMKKDYIGSGITVNIKNPFTREEENISFELDNFDCEKTQTTEWGFDAFCVVGISNEYYEFDKNVVLHYVKYDGNVYEYAGCEETINSYFVKTSPFTKEDVIEGVGDGSGIGNGDYFDLDAQEIKNVVIESNETSLNEINVSYIEVYKLPNATCEQNFSKVYNFDGSEWDFDSSRFYTSYDVDWHIIGKWTGDDVKELVINDLNLDTGEISGYIEIENTIFNLAETRIRKTKNGDKEPLLDLVISEPYSQVWIGLDYLQVVRDGSWAMEMGVDWVDYLERSEVQENNETTNSVDENSNKIESLGIENLETILKNNSFFTEEQVASMSVGMKYWVLEEFGITDYSNIKNGDIKKLTKQINEVWFDTHQRDRFRIVPGEKHSVQLSDYLETYSASTAGAFDDDYFAKEYVSELSKTEEVWVVDTKKVYDNGEIYEDGANIDDESLLFLKIDGQYYWCFIEMD